MIKTVMLSMDSPTFANDLVKEIGAKLGDEIEIVTPIFDRIDGVNPDPSFTDWHNLPNISIGNLALMGLMYWGKSEDGTKELFLFPKEWYASIPDNFPITDIFWKEKNFKPGQTDDDTRFGMLSFGFSRDVR